MTRSSWPVGGCFLCALTWPLLPSSVSLSLLIRTPLGRGPRLVTLDSGSTHMASFNCNWLFKDPIFKYSPILKGVRASHHMNFGATQFTPQHLWSHEGILFPPCQLPSMQSDNRASRFGLFLFAVTWRCRAVDSVAVLGNPIAQGLNAFEPFLNCMASNNRSLCWRDCRTQDYIVIHFHECSASLLPHGRIPQTLTAHHLTGKLVVILRN